MRIPLTVRFNFRKACFLAAGLLALAWFLIRVLPKPSRATYPCQRAAFPIATSFIIWLLGLIGSATLARRSLTFFKQAQVTAGVVCLAIALPLAWFAYLDWPALRVTANEISAFEPMDPSNSPIGTGRGIFPGRVVWQHNPQATDWDGTSNYWWSDANTDPVIVAQMLSRSLRWLTGADGDAEAWDSLFRHHNERRGFGSLGYQEQETIAIKVNMNQITSTGDLSNRSFTAPQLVFALLEQLVEVAGVAPGDITFYDAVRTIPDVITDRCWAVYPEVHFMDLNGLAGRISSMPDPGNPIHWSEEFPLQETGSGGKAFVPLLLSNTDYHINVAGLKGHTHAGVTLCAKNHLGSFMAQSDLTSYAYSPKAAGIHPYLTVHETGGGWVTGGKWSFDARPMDSYNPLVDLMGHKDLGGKTILYIIDALYAVPSQGEKLTATTKWQSEPFNDDWTSSILLSQDPVAIDSVALDMARAEPTMTQVYGNVDNYLHEAALAADPPSGTVYDPESDGIPMSNLGVHEHWNNANHKLYSRNLGKTHGIELVREDPIGKWWVNEQIFGGLAIVESDPYYYFNQLGWFSIVGNSDETYFYAFQIPSMTYLFSNSFYYPWIWSYDHNAWLYSLETGPGWFWNASSMRWFWCL